MGQQKILLPTIRRVITLTALFIFSAILNFATAEVDWKTAFYTDDSSYYLKLIDDGFVQRFRLHKSVCNSIKEATIVTASGKNFTFTRLSTKNLSTEWGILYGLPLEDYCWFGARAEGLDLNNAADIKYVIRFDDYSGNGPYFFTEVENSLVPFNRLLRTMDDSKWIHLGPMGATAVINGGVYYKIWEPYAQEVHLFLHNSSENPLLLAANAELNNPRRLHSLYVPNSQLGHRYHYQFVKNGKYEQIEVANGNIVSPTKIDPMARKIEYDAKGGQHNGYINPRAIVSINSNYRWNYDYVMLPPNLSDYNNWIIYQLWTLTFNPQKKNNSYLPGTYNDVNTRLDYLDDLGVTAIEFLPLNENRFYASWGYALDSLTLTQPNYGSEDELKNLVDNAHARGLRIIFDIVINHINNALIRDPLSQTVARSKFFDGNTDWGPRPRYEMIMVRKWIADSIISQVADYHLDGLRFDMIKYIYRNDENAYRFLQELNYLLKVVHPSIYLSAEELPNNIWATTALGKGGMGFDSQWNDKFKNFFEFELSSYRQKNRSVNLTPLASSIIGYSNHWENGHELNFGLPITTVNYLGSHDFIGNKNPIVRIVSDYSAYEWDGNNSFLRVRPLEDPSNTTVNFRAVHNDFTHALGKLAYGVLFTKPGAILFFQGEEMANDINIENEWQYVDAKQGNAFPSKNVDINRYVGSHKMPWEFLNPSSDQRLSFLTAEEQALFAGYYNFFKQMIRFRIENPEINKANAFNSAIHYNSILTYQLTSGDRDYFVVANFGYDQCGVWINFPSINGWWTELINSSSMIYGGASNQFTNIISYESGKNNQIRSKGPSISIFVKSRDGTINTPLYLRGTFNNWQTQEEFRLQTSSSRGELYSVDFEVSSAGDYEFKLASADWQIEIGQASANLINQQKTSSSGQLSYQPGMANVRVNLSKGKYKFLFNLRDFKYTLVSKE